MVDQLMLQTVGILMTGVSLTIAATYYTLTLRNQERMRKAQFLLQLHQIFRDKEWIRDFNEVAAMRWDSYEDFLEKYDSTVNTEAFLKRMRVYYIYDIQGQLLRKKLVDTETIYTNFGPWSIRDWEKHGPIIEEIRKQTTPLLWSNFEYLAGEMRKIHEKRKQTTA